MANLTPTGPYYYYFFSSGSSFGRRRGNRKPFYSIGFWSSAGQQFKIETSCHGKKKTTQKVTEVGKLFSCPPIIDDLFFMSQASFAWFLENKALFSKTHIYRFETIHRWRMHIKPGWTVMRAVQLNSSALCKCYHTDIELQVVYK